MCREAISVRIGVGIGANEAQRQHRLLNDGDTRSPANGTPGGRLRRSHAAPAETNYPPYHPSPPLPSPLPCSGREPSAHPPRNQSDARLGRAALQI